MFPRPPKFLKSEVGMAGRSGRGVAAVAIAAPMWGAIAVAWARPAWGPAAMLGLLASLVWPTALAWNRARGTALRPAVAWWGIAIALGIVGQLVGLGEDAGTGRPGSGHWVYVSALASLAALISVLNARSPGGGAWAILMGLLVLVFLLPWLEGSGLARTERGWERLRLAAPWTLFFGLLVLAGVTNFLPTRYGPAAGWLGLGFVLIYLAMTRTDWPVDRRGAAWWLFPWTQAAATWSAWRRSGRRGPARSELERIWLRFRDHWGVVWALRVQERFNRSAESLRWPIRLGWQGVEPAIGVEATSPVPAEAAATLVGLLRRFADPARIAEDGPGEGPCPDPGPLG